MSISKRYAKALFDLAQEKKVLEEVNTDFKKIKNILEDSHEFVHLIESPVISKLKQQEILQTLFENKTHKTTLNFLLFLINKRRINLLNEMINQFENFYLEHNNVLKATITTRESLSEDLKQSFLTHLKKKFNKTIDPVWNIDSQILGGFKIQTADHVEDYSLQNQLNQFEKELIYN